MPLQLANPFVIERRTLWTNPNGPRAATDYIVIHHAAAMYPAGQGVQKIYAYHSRKWPDYHAAAYHEIIQIEADGQHLAAHIVNDPQIIGAGVYGRNGNTFHICAASNFVAIPDDGFLEALAQRAAAAKRRWPHAEIVGHKDIALRGYSTACPGPLWSAWKTRLLGRVQTLLQPPSPVPRAGPFGALARTDYRGSGKPAKYYPPGTLIAIDTFHTNEYRHAADGIGFIADGDLEGA